MHYNQLSSNLSLIIKASRFSGMPLLSQNYWVTNVRTIPETNGSYLYFTVNWKYTGNRPNPAIAFMVYIYNGSSLENSFQDSAYGIREGSRDYKIKVFSNTSYSVVVNGSDGGPR